MNIGYCVYGYPVKSQTWIPLEIQEFRRRGYNVNIIDIEKPLDSSKIRECEFLIAHWAYTGTIVKRWGIPFGIVCHAYDIWKDNGQALKTVSQSNNCKFIGCVANYHKEKYKEWGIDKPMFLTPVCCDTDTYKKKKQYLGDSIVAGGRNTEKKGFKYAVQGFPGITLFGNESLKEYKSVNPTLKHYIWPDKEVLRDILDDCWLFVSPNVRTKDGDMDGQCTTIKEALAMELQVLTTPIAGNGDLKYVHFSTPEDIEKGYNGEVYKNIIKERNTAGRKYAVDNFSPQACVDKFIEAIECSK